MKTLSLNKSDYKLIGGYLLITTFWLIYKFTIDAYILKEYLVDIPVALIQIILLLLIAKGLIEYYFIKKGNLIVFISLGILSLWGTSFLTMLSGDFTHYGKIPWEKYGSIHELIIFNIQNSIFNIAIPLSLISGKKYYEHQLNSSELKNTQKELELKILRSQFDPHFLYNSLNTIDAMVDYSSKEKVKEYVLNLASLYRHIVKFKDEEIVSIEDEIALAKNYFFLVETRFENDFDFEIIEKVTVKNKYLPNGALLSVVENIIKHNHPKGNTTIKTKISINEKTIEISNNKSLKQVKSDISGTGLINLKKRYQLLADKKIEINNHEKLFTIKLPLLNILV